MNHSFPRSEKLKSRKRIEQLFEQGKSVSKFPIKVFYILMPDAEKTQVAFAVPKRTFKSAVIRNRIKRQLREVYRTHKHLIITNNGPVFALLILYIGKERPEIKQLELSVASLLKKIQNEN